MDQEGRRKGVSPLPVVLALVVGGVVGWLAGRQSVEIPPPPPPPEWVNPFADAEEGERLVLQYRDGTLDEYLITEALDDSLLLTVSKRKAGGTSSTRSLRVSRNFPGVLVVLDGDLSKAAIDAGLRTFVVHRMVRETVDVAGKSHDAWRIEGRHLHQGMLKIWVNPSMPVHGVLRIEGDRGVVVEMSQ